MVRGDLAVFQSDFVVETSLVGVVLNGLSHFTNVQDRSHFVISLIRGLGGNLMQATHENFAKEVRGNRACRLAAVAWAATWYPVMQSSFCKSFEDRAPVDYIYGCQIFKWLAQTLLKNRFAFVMLVVVLLSMMIVTKKFWICMWTKKYKKIRIWTHQSCLLYLSRETTSHERPHWDGHADRLHYIVFALYSRLSCLFYLSWETASHERPPFDEVFVVRLYYIVFDFSWQTTFHGRPPFAMVFVKRTRFIVFDLMKNHLSWETVLWCSLCRKVPLYCVCSTGVPVEWWDATWPTTCPRHILWRRQNATGYLWNGCKFIIVTSHKCHGISNKWQFYCFIKSLLRLTRKHRNCGLLTVPLWEGLPVTSGFSLQRASKDESGSMSWLIW